MKAFLLVLLAFTLAAGADTFVLHDRVLREATVRKIDAFTVRITHAEGTATLPAWELSPTAQRAAGFDPAATDAEHRRLVAVAQAVAEAKAEAARAEAARAAAAEGAARRAAMETAERNRKQEAQRTAAQHRDEEERERKYRRDLRETQRNAGYDPDKIAKTDTVSWMARMVPKKFTEITIQSTGMGRQIRDHGPISKEELMGYSEEARMSLLMLR